MNSKPEAGDYVLRLEHEGGKGLLAHKDKVVVFERRRAATRSLQLQPSLWAGLSNGPARRSTSTGPQISAALTAPAPPTPSAIEADKSTLIVEASVTGADIEVDGEFVGNAPSTLTVAPGKHTVTVRKKGFLDWSRTMTVSGSAVHLSADLAAAS